MPGVEVTLLAVKLRRFVVPMPVSGPPAVSKPQARLSWRSKTTVSRWLVGAGLVPAA